MKTVKISNDDFLTLDSKEFFLKQNQQYKVLASVSAKAGTLYSSYVCVIILDENNREIDRHIRWIKDFSGKREDYKIIFT
ncbi:MAG: hypothetical protein IH795_10120, partial [Bacteroidetes bacterium]|nr:hypothetical protein [Bacteroidota bacterium]